MGSTCQAESLQIGMQSVVIENSPGKTDTNEMHNWSVTERVTVAKKQANSTRYLGDVSDKTENLEELCTNVSSGTKIGFEQPRLETVTHNSPWYTKRVCWSN